MRLTQKQVDEFKEINKKEFGKKLSNREAMEKGYGLIRLFQIILKPTSSITNSDEQ